MSTRTSPNEVIPQVHSNHYDKHHPLTLSLIPKNLPLNYETSKEEHSVTDYCKYPLFHSLDEAQT